MEKNFIWIGPTIKGTILTTFKIFLGKIPDEFANKPDYVKLFVTPDKLEAARREVGKKGSYLNILYEKISKGVD